jgi:hypothetical protein
MVLKFSSSVAGRVVDERGAEEVEDPGSAVSASRSIEERSAASVVGVSGLGCMCLTCERADDDVEALDDEELGLDGASWQA